MKIKPSNLYSVNLLNGLLEKGKTTVNGSSSLTYYHWSCVDRNKIFELFSSEFMVCRACHLKMLAYLSQSLTQEEKVYILLRDHVVSMTISMLFRFRVQQQWNSLSIDITSCNTLSDFKRKLHKLSLNVTRPFSNNSIIDFLCRFYLLILYLYLFMHECAFYVGGVKRPKVSLYPFSYWK